MKNIQRVAVYCGSALGSDPVFSDAARATAEAMVGNGVDLVYGGGRLGLMGLIADHVLELGGQVYGVIPTALVDLEVAHTWNVLGYHAQPLCLLNVAGFWDGLIEFMDHATASGFLSAPRRKQMLVAQTPDEALKLLDEAAATAAKGMVW